MFILCLSYNTKLTLGDQAMLWLYKAYSIKMQKEAAASKPLKIRVSMTAAECIIYRSLLRKVQATPFQPKDC